MGSPPQNHNWVFDYGVLEDIPVPGGDLPPLDLPGFTWPSRSFVAPAAPRYRNPFTFFNQVNHFAAIGFSLLLNVNWVSVFLEGKCCFY